jgi:hypothetical protein
MEDDSVLEVRVVNEFPYVFLDKLPGMPLDCDIAFVMELVSGTSPIYKRTYMMDSKQLAELKE